MNSAILPSVHGLGLKLKLRLGCELGKDYTSGTS